MTLYLLVNLQGTTGNPKGATLSHHNILNNAYYVGEILDYENQVCFFFFAQWRMTRNKNHSQDQILIVYTCILFSTPEYVFLFHFTTVLGWCLEGEYIYR